MAPHSTSKAPASLSDAPAPVLGPHSPRVPFFDQFACRQSELDLLGTLLRRAFHPSELTEADSKRIAAHLEHEHGAGQPSTLRSLVFVQGRSGMGKSRLLRELATEAYKSGVRVKEIYCYERQGVPFLPALRMVKELVSESATRQPLWQKYARVLSRVFPELARELGEARTSSELPGEDGKLQLFDTMAAILLEISRERPLLLFFHDLQRSDYGTVEFLRYLGRNVFLEDAAQRRDGRGAEADGAAQSEDWKEIRNRDGRAQREFITDGLGEEAASPDLDLAGAKLMVVANYLDLAADGRATPPADGGEEESEVEVVKRIQELGQEPFALHLALPPLDDRDTASLIARTIRSLDFPPEVTDRIHRLTGGNPLYALEICRSMLEEGAGIAEGGEAARISLDLLDRVVAGGAPSPADATAPGEKSGADEPARAGAPPQLAPEEQLCRHVIQRRLASLRDEVAVQLLEVLAVLRRPAPILLLERLLERPRERIGEALSVLENRDFIHVLAIEHGPRFLLAHEDYNRWIYASLSPERRSAVHERIGEVLAAHERAAEPVRAFEIYEHLRQSPNSRACFAFGRTAARYFADAFAVGLAVRIDLHLLSLLPAPEDLLPRLELLRELAELELRRGRVNPGKGHIKRALEEGARVLDAEQRLAAWMILGDLYLAEKEPHKGIKVLNRAQKSCAQAIDPRKSATIVARLAQLRLARNDTKRAINLCMSGMRDLENAALGDVERIPLMEILAEAHRMKGGIPAALEHYQTLLEMVERAGDEAKLASILATLGRLYYDRGNYFRAARYLFRALDAIRRTQDLRALSRTYDLLGKVYRNSGDLLRGLEYFNRSLRLRERIGDLEGISPTLNSLGSLYAHTGDYLRAIRYFKRSVENSERLGDTAGIVRSFLHLGRVYHDIGELRQVESLAKQILILSQEFNLAVLEGEGHRLNGELLFLRRDWRKAERELRRAMEIAARNGRKNGEAWATLALGSLLAEKEDYEGALKLISRAQLLAEEMQSVPLKARTHLLKGNVYRFLKGGNQERAKESFRKGLEIVSGENHLPILWELDYSMAKLFQANLEYAEAGEAYRRAEQVLERIAGRLPEDMKAAYRDDNRRKTFLEDYRRFQKEASGRQGSAAVETVAAPRDERVARGVPARAAVAGEAATSVVDRLVEVLLRLGNSQRLADWGPALLQEARRLVPSPVGYLMALFGDEPRVLAAADMGADASWISPQRVAGAVGRTVAAERVAILSGDERWQRLLGSSEDAHGFRNRSALALPIPPTCPIPGALYLERPSAANPFLPQEQQLLEKLLAAVAGSFAALFRLDALCHLHGTALLSRSGLEEQIDLLAARAIAGRGDLVL